MLINVSIYVQRIMLYKPIIMCAILIVHFMYFKMVIKLFKNVWRTMNAKHNN